MINDKLYKEIEQFCKLNNIDDVEQEINTILQIGFNVIRFGVSPFQQTVNIPQEEEVKEEAKVPKKRGRKPKQTIVEEKQEVDIKTEEPQKVKVRIIKNK